MDIISYQPDYLSELTNLYNEVTSPVPHCYPIYAEELTDAFSGLCGYEAFGERLEKEDVFVAIDQDVIGFVHVGKGRISKEKEAAPQGIIRFLAYPRGRRDAGQALLERAEDWLQDHGLDSVLVYRQTYRYPFYHFSHAYISNHLEHIQALLLFNGYQECGGEVFLDWPDMDPTPSVKVSDLEIDLSMEHETGSGHLPNLHLKAYHKNQKVGECVSVSAGVFSNREVVKDWIFTQWLGVSDAYQGKGLGRYLLGYTLEEACKVGYKHAAISTALDNYRAQLFYANYGYQAVDWTRQFKRDLPNNS